MGLDMYLKGRKFIGRSGGRKEDGYSIDGITIDLGYWRKHRKLHGFIINTFAKGKDECQEIYLEVDDLRKIAKAITKNDLPYTTGFFFGNDGTDEEEGACCKEYAKQFDDAARWLEGGDWKRTVVYRASW